MLCRYGNWEYNHVGLPVIGSWGGGWGGYGPGYWGNSFASGASFTHSEIWLRETQNGSSSHLGLTGCLTLRRATICMNIQTVCDRSCYACINAPQDISVLASLTLGDSLG